MGYSGRKAQKTEYNGTEFKSQLESSWAMFFDWEAIPWEYEPTKVQIDAVRFYTPDFFLHLFDPPIVVEIKPTWEMAVEDPRILGLSGRVSNLCLAACGNPYNLLYGRDAKDVRVYLLEDAEVTHVWIPGPRDDCFTDWVNLQNDVRKRTGYS